MGNGRLLAAVDHGILVSILDTVLLCNVLSVDYQEVYLELSGMRGW
jgi:hypothetical protein